MTGDFNIEMAKVIDNACIDFANFCQGPWIGFTLIFSLLELSPVLITYNNTFFWPFVYGKINRTHFCRSWTFIN